MEVVKLTGFSKTSMPSYCPKCEEYDAFVVVYVTNPFHFLLNLSIPNNHDNADFVRIPINSKMVKLSLFIGGTYTFCSLLGTLTLYIFHRFVKSLLLENLICDGENN